MTTKIQGLSLPESEAASLLGNRKFRHVCSQYGAEITTEPHNNAGWVFVMIETDNERQAWLVKGFMIAMNDFEVFGPKG